MKNSALLLLLAAFATAAPANQQQQPSSSSSSSSGLSPLAAREAPPDNYDPSDSTSTGCADIFGQWVHLYSDNGCADVVQVICLRALTCATPSPGWSSMRFFANGLGGTWTAYSKNNCGNPAAGSHGYNAGWNGGDGCAKDFGFVANAVSWEA